jgi:monovalent cation:H+ antiporter-2, CPA2 family
MTITIDPILPSVVGLVLIVLLISIVLRIFKQPYIVAYIIAGIIIGPYGLGIISDEVTLSRLGAIGVVLLLFFIGMEISLKKLVLKWRVATIGTFLQILISVAAVWLISTKLGWTLERIILLGFVISLSSTAVVLKILQDRKELSTKIGQNILSILLMQDIALVPMLIIISFVGGEAISKGEIGLQIVGGIAILVLFAWLLKKDTIKLPFGKILKKDHEIQVFSAFTICFGIAMITALTGLSAALGAFIAGIIVSAAKETKWVHDSLHSFYIIFVALFFISIGMLIDVNFLIEHIKVILLLVIAVFLTNTFINALILKFLGDTWKESLYSGALLSQIGEFSFILATVGFQSAIINQFTYQTTIVIIALTLLLSPFWIYLIKSMVKIKKSTNTKIY